MRRLSLLITYIFFTIRSFGQFSDTSALNAYIRDTIKDRRPEKVTAAQLQKALLGTTKFLNIAPNFSNSDLLFNGNRTHNGNQKNLRLNNFGSIRWKANNIDSTMGSEFTMDSVGDMTVTAKSSYNSFSSNSAGDPYWYVDTRDPSTNNAGLMYASPVTVQMASVGSESAQSLIAMYNNKLDIAATDGNIHGDSTFVAYSKLSGAANNRIVAAAKDGSLQFIDNEDYIGLDTAYRYIEQKDKNTLSLLRRTSFNQNRSGFTFTSSGSSNPNLLFYAQNLPTTTDTGAYKPLGYNPSSGQFVKFNGWSDVVHGASFWNLSGNTGTDPSSNFIGTTDAQDLAVKTNNTLRAFFTYDGRFKVGNESFKNAGRQAVFIDSVNAANVLSIENPQAGFSSNEVLSLFQNFNNYADISKYNSSYSGTYLNTSIPFAGSLSIGVRYNGADYGAPIIASGSSFITVPSTTGTDFGIKADKFGLRIDKINALHTSNGPRVLYVNGSIGANKDSVTRQTVAGARHMLAIDTTSGKFERMPISAITGAITFDKALENGSTLTWDRYINLNNRILSIGDASFNPYFYLDPYGDFAIGDFNGATTGTGIWIQKNSKYVFIGNIASGSKAFLEVNDFDKQLLFHNNNAIRFQVKGDGRVAIPSYGADTITGTPTSNLAVDAEGNIIETPIGSSSQWTTTGSDIYYNTGKVGIGLNSPSSPLHVREMLTGSDATITTYINPIWNTTGDPTAFKVNPLVIANGGASLLADFQYSGASRLGIRHDGFVSIGAAAYSSKLNINATTTENYLTLTIPGNFSGDPVDVKYSIKPINGLYGPDPFARGGIQFKNESTFGGDTTTGVFSFDGYVGIGTTSPATTLDVNGTVTANGLTSQPSSDLSLQASSGQDIFLATNGTTRAWIKADGSIDIGSVSSPFGTVKLNVGGNVQSNDAFILSGSGVNAELGVGGSLAFLRTASNHPLQFKTNDVERYRVTANGNININDQSNDTYKLYVNGSVAANKDSISRIEDLSATQRLLQDTTTGKFKRARLPQRFAQTATVTVSSTNTETTLVGSGQGSLTIPASAWVVGKTYRVTIAGRYTSDPDNPMSLHPKVKLGSVVIAEKNTFIGSNKDAQFRVVLEFTCRTTGSSGTIMTFGNMWSEDAINDFSNGTSTSTIDMTTNQTINVTGILSDDSAGNSISAYMILLEEVN